MLADAQAVRGNQPESSDLQGARAAIPGGSSNRPGPRPRVSYVHMSGKQSRRGCARPALLLTGNAVRARVLRPFRSLRHPEAPRYIRVGTRKNGRKLRHLNVIRTPGGAKRARAPVTGCLKNHVAFLIQDCYLISVQGRRRPPEMDVSPRTAQQLVRGTKAMIQQVWQKVRSLVSDEKGVSALEYAVLAVGIVLAVVAAASTLGGAVSGLFNKIGSSL
jgi:pilus assembly protein Flp/PilA